MMPAIPLLSTEIDSDYTKLECKTFKYNDRRCIINMSHVYLHYRREPKEVQQWESGPWDIIIIHWELIRIAGLILCTLNEKSSWHSVKINRSIKPEPHGVTLLWQNTKRSINHKTSWYKANESLHKMEEKQKNAHPDFRSEVLTSFIKSICLFNEHNNDFWFSHQT